MALSVDDISAALLLQTATTPSEPTGNDMSRTDVWLATDWGKTKDPSPLPYRTSADMNTSGRIL